MVPMAEKGKMALTCPVGFPEEPQVMKCRGSAVALLYVALVPTKPILEVMGAHPVLLVIMELVLPESSKEGAAEDRQSGAWGA